MVWPGTLPLQSRGFVTSSLGLGATRPPVEAVVLLCSSGHLACATLVEGSVPLLRRACAALGPVRGCESPAPAPYVRVRPRRGAIGVCVSLEGVQECRWTRSARRVSPSPIRAPLSPL